MSKKRGSGTRRNPAARYVGSRAPGTRRLKIKIGVPRSANQRSLSATFAVKRRSDERSNHPRPA